MAMSMRETPFWAFNCAYLLFLSPVLRCLFVAYLGLDPGAWEAQLLPQATDAGSALAAAAGLALWFAGLGALLRLAIARLGWKQGWKGPAQHKDDFVRMAYASVSLATLARLNGRAEVSFLLLVGSYAVSFSVLFEMVRGINLEIAANLAQNLRGLWIVAVGVVVLLGVLHAHMRLAFAQGGGFGPAYLGWIALVLGLHCVAQALPPSALGAADASRGVRLHVHHWYWAFLASHFAVFDSALSCHAQAIFLGVYVHGAACFGVEPIFEAEHVKGATD